eukprot:TRINITY_DN106880_c0_g1_i1.p1 TRINITY_DN106880_c0_g1~~TRINITY_DN106880_c0_g1_i1.p1  ORF type:complete len:359 (+),score=57.70 TRINITY_DN106880_c0_g1_i1:28-1077(+)
MDQQRHKMERGEESNQSNTASLNTAAMAGSSPPVAVLGAQTERGPEDAAAIGRALEQQQQLEVQRQQQEAIQVALGLSPNDLAARGYSPQQLQSIETQRHQQEVLQAHFARWSSFFFCGLCLLLPAMFAITIWLIIEWNMARSRNDTCDTWLIEWVNVVYVLLCYHLCLHSCVIKIICKYDPQRTMQETGVPPRPPARVRIYNMLFPVFDFCWKVTGIILAATSNTCPSVMPELHRAVLAYACLGILITCFTAINSIGLMALLSYMMRNGMLHSSAAAPAGTLEAQEVVSCSTLPDGAECSICLDGFSSNMEIRRTACGHAFHSTCLKGWLNVNHTCPLCREDLAAGGV